MKVLIKILLIDFSALTHKNFLNYFTEMCTFDDDDNMCDYTQEDSNDLYWDVKSGDDDDIAYRMPDHTTQSIEGNNNYSQIFFFNYGFKSCNPIFKLMGLKLRISCKTSRCVIIININNKICLCLVLL